LTGNSDAAFSLFLANNHSECRKRCGLRDEHLGEIAALRAGAKTIFVARASSGWQSGWGRLIYGSGCVRNPWTEWTLMMAITFTPWYVRWGAIG
jgi:hypothetical protein